MKTEYFLSFCKFLLIIFCICIFSRNVFSQNNFVEKSLLLNFLASDNNQNFAPTRPRIVNTSEKAVKSDKDNSVKSATTYSFEQQVFELINKKRAEIGLPALVWNDDVARIARIHSENMANYKFFSHAGLDGKMVNNRADDLGVSKWRAIGENIAYNRGFANPIEFAVEGWMKSPAHRDNILSERWKESGIGIAIASDGTYYFTEVFLLRR